MGKTWKHKKLRGLKGRPHRQAEKTGGGIGKAKLRRALRQELDLTPARLDKIKPLKERGFKS